MWLAYSFVHSIEIPINRVVFIFCVLIIGAVSLGQRYKKHQKFEGAVEKEDQKSKTKT